MDDTKYTRLAFTSTRLGHCRFDLKFIGDVLRRCRAIFPSVAYSSIYIPTYPGGQIGFLLASNSANVDFVKARTVFTDEDCERLKLRFVRTTHCKEDIVPYFMKEFPFEYLTMQRIFSVLDI